MIDLSLKAHPNLKMHEASLEKQLFKYLYYFSRVFMQI